LKVVSILLKVLALAAPILASVLVSRRLGQKGLLRQSSASFLIFTFLLGAAVFLPASIAERFVQDWAGLDENAALGADLATLVYVFFVASPIEEGLQVAAVMPAWRSRHLATTLDGVLYAATVALGFATAHGAALLFREAATPLDALRVVLAAPTHMCFAGAWGYALGHDKARWAEQHGGRRRRTIGGLAFNLSWLGATLFSGVYDYIVFARGTIALIAAAFIMAAVAALGALFARARRLDEPAPETVAPRSLGPAAPSLRAMRAALFRSEQPVMIRWIFGGALVTTGVMTAMIAGAVVLGHRWGVDFAAVDRSDASDAITAAPLALLGGAALLAFPIAGYLIARASATRSVLESALAAALAIGGALVLLGLASPIAVVFAIAFAPVAFGLACAGAWLGIRRS